MKRLLWLSHAPVQLDAYLFGYQTGDYVPPHVHTVGADRREYRLNIVLRSADEGGEFVCENQIFETRRIKFFRADLSEHSVTRITKGSRLILSLGCIL